jgi:hypothetical protein
MDFTADICNEAQSTAIPIVTSGSRTKMIVIITAKPGFVADFASHRVRGAVDDVNSRILCRGSLEKAYDGKDLNKFHDVALVYICWLVSLVESVTFRSCMFVDSVLFLLISSLFV